MARRSPTPTHGYWGNGFAAYAQLPTLNDRPTIISCDILSRNTINLGN